MSLRDDILHTMGMYNIYKVTIDKDTVTHGVSGTKVILQMHDPQGYHTGKVFLEATFDDTMKLKDDHLIGLLKSMVDNEISRMKLREKGSWKIYNG